MGGRGKQDPMDKVDRQEYRDHNRTTAGERHDERLTDNELLRVFGRNFLLLYPLRDSASVGPESRRRKSWKEDLILLFPLPSGPSPGEENPGKKISSFYSRFRTPLPSGPSPGKFTWEGRSLVLRQSPSDHTGGNMGYAHVFFVIVLFAHAAYGTISPSDKPTVRASKDIGHFEEMGKVIVSRDAFEFRFSNLVRKFAFLYRKLEVRRRISKPFIAMYRVIFLL